ncbi:MAG: hypothetical protein ACYSYL_04540 [Planctomycetota bacterium]|jgi:hypothetical protein
MLFYRPAYDAPYAQNMEWKTQKDKRKDNIGMKLCQNPMKYPDYALEMTPYTDVRKLS